MRKMLSLGPIGEFGGALYRIGEHQFIYNGAPSVTITFNVEEGKVKSLMLKDPDVAIEAKKIS